MWYFVWQLPFFLAFAGVGVVHIPLCKYSIIVVAVMGHHGVVYVSMLC